MRYIIADKTMALDYGFSLEGHRTSGTLIAINEKELLCCPALASAPTLEAKSKLVGGRIYTHKEAVTIIKNWRNG